MEKKPVEVTITRNGPIKVKGFFSFRDSSGKSIIKEQEIFFCRCGSSSNKPFCDETHCRVGIKN